MFRHILNKVRDGFLMGLGLAFALGLTALLAQSMHRFSSGEVLSASYINENFQMAAPAGAIMAFYLTACPSGWVMADGTNNTPDLRGRFIRGLDDMGVGAAGRDLDYASRVNDATLGKVGSTQGQSFQAHAHRANGHAHDNPNGANGQYVYRNLSGGFWDYMTMGGGGIKTSGFTRFTPNAAADIREPTTLTTYNAPVYTNETRPLNIALIYCMRKDG